MKQNQIFFSLADRKLLVSFFVMAIIIALAFPLSAARAGAGYSATITPANGKVGEPFTLVLDSGGMSTIGNYIIFQDDSGDVAMAQAASLDGKTASGVYPVLAPGTYWIDVITNDEVELQTNAEVQIIAGGNYPTLKLLLGFSTRASGQDAKIVTFLFDNLNDLYAKVSLEAGGQVTETFGLFTIFLGNLPVNLSGSVPVRAKINNYYTDPLTVQVPDANSYSIIAPSGEVSVQSGQQLPLNWTGGKALAIELIDSSRNTVTDPVTGEGYIIAENVLPPYNWILPDFLDNGTYYLVLTFGDETKILGKLISAQVSEDFLEKLGTEELDELDIQLPYTEFIHFLQSDSKITITNPANYVKLPINWTRVAHPAGTLVSDNGTIYEINGRWRTGYPSVPVFRSNGNRFEEVVPASEGDRGLPALGVAKYRDGDLIVDQGVVYIIYQGKKYGFTSREVFEDLGYNFANVYLGDLSAYPEGGQITRSDIAHSYGTIVNSKGTLFLMTPFGKQGIPSMAIAQSNKLRLEKVVPANAADDMVPQISLMKFREGSLVSVDGGVYLIQDGKRRPFTSSRPFEEMSFKDSNVISVRGIDIEDYPDGFGLN